MVDHAVCVVFFFFQAEDGIRDVAVTGVQTCALPISLTRWRSGPQDIFRGSNRAHLAHVIDDGAGPQRGVLAGVRRSEEHTSELQSRLHLVCRLLLEKKKQSGSPLTQ